MLNAFGAKWKLIEIERFCGILWWICGLKLMVLVGILK